MRRTDNDETDVCVVCGEEIDPAEPSNFSLASEDRVCRECARRRGGVFDAAAEDWTAPPRIRPAAHGTG